MVISRTPYDVFAYPRLKITDLNRLLRCREISNLSTSNSHLRRTQTEHLRPDVVVSHRGHPSSSSSLSSEERSVLRNQQTNHLTLARLKKGIMQMNVADSANFQAVKQTIQARLVILLHAHQNGRAINGLSLSKKFRD
jgi:hypothetical protein